MIGLARYDSPQKQSWRCWQWNRIMERFPEWDGRKPPSPSSSEMRRAAATKKVMYLRGPHDFDGEEAIKRGFARGNLYAVDIEKDYCNSAINDHTAICDSMEQQLFSWGDDPIDVLVADTCYSLSRRANTLRLAMHCCGGLSKTSVISVTLQRGRDAICVPLLDYIRSMSSKHFKHRAEAWYIAGMLHFFEHMRANGTSSGELMDVAEAIHQHSRPASYTYSGSSVTMDSIVFRWQFDSASLDRSELKSIPSLRKSRSRRAAAKAVFTRHHLPHIASPLTSD